MASQPFENFKAELLTCVQKSHRFALSLTQDRHDAEDLVQDALIKALTHWETFEGGTNMQAWLNRIVRNNFLDRMKRHDETRTETVGDDTYKIEQAVGGSEIGAIQTEEVQDFLYAEMPVGERSVVMLWAEGYSYEEIAQDLGISRSNAGIRLLRARKRLFDKFGSITGNAA